MINKYSKYQQVAAIKLEFGNLFRSKYPRFVFDRNGMSLGGTIPVFCFHDLNAKDFEAKLSYLKQNDYRSIDSDELHNYLCGTQKLPERTVALTFDDGRQDVWTIAYPLLSKYGFKGIVFLIPSYIEDDETIRPSPEDHYQESTIPATGLNDRKFVSWQEIEIMHESGVMDFQSHGLHHRQIHCGMRIVDFIRPSLSEAFFYKFNIPVMAGEETWESEFSYHYGAPIYEYAPFFSANKRYLEDVQLRQVLVASVGKYGGEDFFRRREWRKKLMHVVRSYRRNHFSNLRFETDSEQEERIVEDLERSRKLIEHRLPGKSVRHISYPWGTGSEVAVRSSKYAGYKSNYWMIQSDRKGNRPGDDPYYITRIKHDFIWRLPGEGRKSLLDILLLKSIRRVKGQIDY